MKYYELDKEEKQLLDAMESGELVRVKKASQLRKQYERSASSTLSKSRNINIRIPEKDLLKIKARAAEKGIPYQTLLTALIHQYSTGQVSDRLLSTNQR